ncbi:hypothetical protein [Agromyces indicus]|uniref:Uncharacterized protein n=1 Tax=Agromyces indicus TaxID=758919 RepID=A0ABU1FKE3_9MICO|nr:hypothetical protein [Agromyces indicus]MDR5691871.1 hypothetical protein [Agromyces indicus]
MPSTPATRAARDRARRTADLAEREATTLAMLGDRLPDYEPRVAFPDLWRDVKHLRGILPRNAFYAFLTTLDGAHLHEDLLVRIRHHESASRRSVLIRTRRSWEEQRAYLGRYLARGRRRPPRPVSYKTAHARVRAERGLASNYSCVECGEPAAEWAYDGFSPDEQIDYVTFTTDAGIDRRLMLWSPNPADYSPLCWLDHVRRDESGLAFGVGPAPSPKPRTLPPAPPLPADAPDWVRRIAAGE